MLQDLRFFVPRNAIVIGFLISVFSAILIGECSRTFAFRRIRWLLPFSIFLLTSINIFTIRSIGLEPNTADLVSCRSVGVIGQNFKSDLPMNATSIASIPNAYVFSTDEKKFIESLNSFDCLFAKWSKNDKSFTNYILPRYFVISHRVGNEFFFKRTQL